MRRRRAIQGSGSGTRWFSGRSALATCWLGAALLLGCKSVPPAPVTDADMHPYVTAGVQPGDILKISFPGATAMNTSQQVQSDGTITLQMGGSLQVNGKAPPEIEKALLEVYGPQLVVKQVAVSVESAGFPVFVSGAVMRSGRVVCRQSVTVLEAIVDAGGFNEGRADLKRVKVVRKADDGKTKTYVLDLRSALRGEPGTAFYLRPSDVIYVPERFSFY